MKYFMQTTNLCLEKNSLVVKKKELLPVLYLRWRKANGLILMMEEQAILGADNYIQSTVECNLLFQVPLTAGDAGDAVYS